MLLVLVRAKIHIRPYPPKRKRGNGTFSYLCLPTEPSDDTHHGTSSFPTDTRVHPPAPHGRCAHTRPPAVERIFVFIGIGLEISGTIPCEWGDVLYLLRLSEMKSVIKM